MTSMDGVRLEGWLVKKRGDYHKNKFFHYDSMRWFKLQEVNGTDHSELAFCYYKTQKEKEPRGWIFMKDVTEIQDSNTGFTLITPARNLVIETASSGEMATWLRALIESCPQANVDKVRNIPISQPKSANGGVSSSQWSKEEEADLDEYRPLDRDGLMQLHQLTQSGKDSSGKSMDRSTSLFSRHADGDKNSFYFASSGQTQKLAALPGVQQSSDEEGDGGQRHTIVGEGELMAELGGMQRDQSRRGSKGGVASDRERDNSRGSRDNREADHRLNSGRAAGGYGGGESSTSNRLHRHIARDSPARGSSATDTVNPNVHRRRGADTAAGEESADSAAGAGPLPSDRAFNSAGSLRVNTSSPPSPQSTRATAERSPNGGIEVVDAGRRTEGQERAARSKAMLRDRQRRNQLRRSKSGSGSDSGSDDGAGRRANSDSSASDSDGDYARPNRTAVSNKDRRRGEDPDSRGGSGAGTPTQRFAGKTLAGSSNNGSGGNLKPVPAPLAAPPRRARDALLQEAAADGTGSPGRAPVRESLDEVLRRRPSVDVPDAKVGAPSSRVNDGSDDEDAQIDFKAEMRRYGAGRGDDGAGLSSSTQAEAKETGAPSRPPRCPPPPINVKPPYGSSNIYSASAAAVIASANKHNSGAGGAAGVPIIAANLRRGVSTPPRQPGDAGSKVDRNFVDEDWDAGDDAPSASNPAAARAEDKRSAPGGGKQHASTVRADANWLEEDFDES